MLERVGVDCVEGRAHWQVKAERCRLIVVVVVVVKLLIVFTLYVITSFGNLSNRKPPAIHCSPMAMITPRQIVRNLGGHSTEVLVQTFADRVLVLITQMGKVGTLVLPKFC